MPSRTKVNKEDIIIACFELVRKNGIDYLNARNIAQNLNCLVQPIFSNFKNMEFDLGVSLTKITNLNLDAGNFDLGTGKVIISSLNVKDHIHIDSGVGNITIRTSK